MDIYYSVLGDMMSRGYTYNPKGFHEIAETIKDDENYKSESRYRTSIGRYYYYIYLTVRDLILKSDKRPNILWALSSSKSHANIRLYIKELAEITNNDDFEKLAEKIKSLHELRKKADYITHIRITSNNIEKAEELTNEIIQLLENIKYSNKKGLKNILDHLVIKEMNKKVSNENNDKKYLPNLDLD